jgi:hypothetical protein
MPTGPRSSGVRVTTARAAIRKAETGLAAAKLNTTAAGSRSATALASTPRSVSTVRASHARSAAPKALPRLGAAAEMANPTEREAKPSRVDRSTSHRKAGRRSVPAPHASTTPAVP